MSLLNKLTSALTGQGRRFQTIEGRKVESLYQGKFIAINPFNLVRDIGFRIPIEAVNNSVDSKGLTKADFVAFLPDIQGVRHSLVVKSPLECGLYKVGRSVISGDRYSTSRYDFILDNQVLCSMLRKYDHGSDFEEIHQNLVLSLGREGLANANSYTWKGQNGEILCLEKFGHTHLYRVLDQTKLMELIQEVSL